MKRLNRLPEYVEYEGYALRYVGSERLELKCDTWLRHTYHYLGGTTQECFFEMVGESGSLNLDGKVQVISTEKAESLPIFHQMIEPRKTPQRWSQKPKRQPRASLDKAAASARMQEVLVYLDERRKSKTLGEVIRLQIRPFGGE